MTMFNERTPFEKTCVILGFLATAGLSLFLLHCAFTDAARLNPKHIQLLLKDYEYQTLINTGESSAILSCDTFHVGETINASPTMKGPVIKVTVTEKKKVKAKDIWKQRNREYLKGASSKAKKATKKIIKKHRADSLVLIKYTMSTENE